MADRRLSVEVHPPMIIGPRLMPAYRIGDVGTIHITPNHYDERDCLVWEYMVCDARERLLVAGQDIIDGAGNDINATATTDSLLGFMGAAGDAYEYEMRNGEGSSENGKMFPPDFMEWCYVNADAIASAQFDLTYAGGDL